MRAESMLAVMLGEPFVHPYPERPPAIGVYKGDDLTIRAAQWFDQHYGERLKLNFSPGSTVVLVRNDPWMIRLPRFYGSWLITTEDSPSDLPDNVPSIIRRDGKPMTYNCLRSLEDIPETFREALTSTERDQVKSQFSAALDAFNTLENMPSSELVSHARADIRAAVGHLEGHTRNHSLSKWSSLQAAEKILKAYIRSQGSVFPPVHVLEDLAVIAERCGLFTVDRNMLADIQCAPKVRYGEVAVPLHDAVQAHHQSLAVARHVGFGFGVPSIFARAG